MKNFKKDIGKGNFKEIYEYLQSCQFKYDIESFTKLFRGVDRFQKYTFLLYVIARNPSAELHQLVCEMLVYTDTVCDDVYWMVRWHVLQGLSLDPNNQPLLYWTVNYFKNNPSSPFTEQELTVFSDKLINE